MAAVGRLKVFCVKANNVADLDFGFAGDSDPYLVVEVDGQWKHTKTQRGDLNPIWNEEFEFLVQDPENQQVNFLLWDSEWLRQDTIIASCSIGLNNLVQGEKRGYELNLIRCGPEGESSGSVTVELLAMNFSGLKVTMDKLNSTIGELEGTTDTLKQAQEGLTTEVGQLREAEAGLKQEVSDLQGLNGQLQKNLSSMGQKMKVLESTTNALKQTRDEMDQKLQEMEGQNEQLKSQLDDLRSIQESMKAFADQAGEDFSAFVDKLTDQVSRNEQLVGEFAEQNAKLKQNRKQQQVNMLLQMSTTFQNWDNEVGLSPDEFQQYLSLLGPDYERRIRTRLSSDQDNPFGKLDADNSGSLNVQEVRNLLQDILDEIEAEEEP